MVRFNGSTNFDRIQYGAWFKSSCAWNLKFGNVPILDMSSFQLCLGQVSDITFSGKKLDHLFNCKSGISNVCNAVEGHRLQALKIVHRYANGCFDWLIPEQQSVNPSRKVIYIQNLKTR